MRRSAAIIALIVAAATTTPSRAQDYPSRPIRALTTTSAGGISDIFMRALGDELHKRWGQPIVVENRPGGMQNVGTRACGEAPPDGYTVCIINADPLVYNQFLLKNMPFDPEKVAQPVTNLYHLIQVLVVNSSLKTKTVDELIALSKAKAGTLSYVTAAPPLALYMEKLKQPKPIVDKLSREVASIVSDPAFRERHLTARSLTPAINTPEQFAEEIKKDRAAAQQVVKDAGLEPQ